MYKCRKDGKEFQSRFLFERHMEQAHGYADSINGGHFARSRASDNYDDLSVSVGSFFDHDSSMPSSSPEPSADTTTSLEGGGGDFGGAGASSEW